MAEIGARLFINYRSEDTGETASRLFQELERELAPSQVFIDHERLEAGTPWPDRLHQEVENASILFCLVGKRWLMAQDPETGDRRLNLPDDWVRREIEIALGSDSITVVPVLVDEAAPLPRKAFQTLPSLATLADRQCLQLRRKDWSGDFHEILAFLLDRGFKQQTAGAIKGRGDLTQPGQMYSHPVQQYRRRVSGLYDRWDLSSVGISPSEAGTKPIEVRLDDIYLPLRLAKADDPDKNAAGAVLSSTALVLRDRPLVIRGVGGAGKTTWVRWTFRRLLGNDGAFPIAIELRRLAASWGKPTTPQQERSIEGYTQALLTEYTGLEWEKILRGFLLDPSGPRPVLFVDGWDELGTLGEEVRFKLVGFQRDYPRVLVVATSRPYGEGRPSQSDGFDIFDIQPLSRNEIEYFAHEFYHLCWGQDERAADEYKTRFLTSLDRSPEAAALAQTTLLLTMMLFISRVKQLPDKRHLLYRTCVEHLLTALPERKREEGVLMAALQWRPSDIEEILRVTAKLAFMMQSQKHYERSTIILSRDEIKGLLPDSWREEQRTRFLNWLIGSAGLLIDRSDESVSFAHLSFQEYLAAWHLYATIEGSEERKKTCLEKLEERSWWETLRLWTALVGGQQPEKVAPILEGLLEDDAGLCLSGTILADGLGSHDLFAKWIPQLLDRIRHTWPRDIEDVARAWLSSRQEDRRSLVISHLVPRARKATWVEWIRYRSFVKSIGSTAQLALPPAGTNSRTLIEASYGQLITARHFALGRLLCSGSPLWPGEPRELALLQAWPGPRRLLGHRLQVLASLGASRSALVHALELYAKPQALSVRLQRCIVASELSAAAVWLGLGIKEGRSPVNMFFHYALSTLDVGFSDALDNLKRPADATKISVQGASEFLSTRGRPQHAALLRKLVKLETNTEAETDEIVRIAVDFCDELDRPFAELLLDWLRVTKGFKPNWHILAKLQASVDTLFCDFVDDSHRLSLDNEESDFSWDWMCHWMRGSLEPLLWDGAMRGTLNELDNLIFSTKRRC